MADIQALNKLKGNFQSKAKKKITIPFISSASFTNFTFATSRGQKKRGIKSLAVVLVGLRGNEDAGGADRDAEELGREGLGVDQGC